MEEFPIAISASQELLKAAPCIGSDPDSNPDPVIGSDPDCSVVDSGTIGGESLEDFRLTFKIKIKFQN